MKNDIIVAHRDDLNANREIIWTQCQFQSKRSESLFLASLYRPNRNDIDSLQELDSSLFKLGDRLKDWSKSIGRWGGGAGAEQRGGGS